MVPLGVIAPADEEDLLTLVKYACTHQIGLTARGGGTGLAGESLTSELVVDLTRHFNRIIEIRDDSIRVQPGVVAQRVNQELFPMGKRLAIDSASEASCTLGGMLATNASGTRVMKHGYMRKYVLQSRAVIGTGQIVSLKQHRTSNIATPTAEDQLAHELHRLILENQRLIATCQPKTPYNRCGYLLHDLMEGPTLSLQKVMIGSEGTLGIITEATINTVPLPRERAVLLLGFTSVQEAAETAPFLIETAPCAIELLDRRLLAMACEVDPVFKHWLSPSMQAALLIEWEGTNPGTVLPLVEEASGLVRQHSHPVVERLALGNDEAEYLWSLRSKALPALHASTKRSPVAFVEDIAVPVAALAGFLSQVQALLPKHDTSASILCHAGAGIVHLRPLFDLHRPDEVRKLQAFAEDVYSEVFRVGGTISAQHGVGLARTPWMAQQNGPLMEVFRQIKTLFDPVSIYNPGKLLGGAGSPLQYLRATSSTGILEPNSDAASITDIKGKTTPLPVIEWEMNWSSGSPLSVAEACHGCGACRTTSISQRMCPIFHAERTEEASPRAKANLLREALAGPDSNIAIHSDEFRSIADLCVNCKMCSLECPSRVAIPQLMLEAKAQNVAEQGLRWRELAVSRLDTWARWGSRWAWMINGMLSNQFVRWNLEKLFGITRHRKLPLLHADTFHHRAKRLGWTKLSTSDDRPRVLYFADTYAQYFDPSVAEATVKVLHLAGVHVYVPPEPLHSGAASLSVGHIERAKRLARRNINVLEPLTREGYTILCSEPTTAVMLTQDYLSLVDDPGAHQVARHTVELMSYLSQLRNQGKLPQVKSDKFPLSIGHHIPCHIKALQKGVEGAKMLRQSGGYRVHTLDMSCSGMAGVYGLQQANYASSLKAGKPMLDRFNQDDLHFGSSECSSCRIQMEHFGKKPVLHPVQWLALAYGLMPELMQQLTIAK
ncbi:MAG: FAD-linked oxidase C-terminal domain-containing protein [Gemmatales bacterium]